MKKNMLKSDSSRSHESRGNSADSSKAWSKHRTFNCFYLKNISPKLKRLPTN